MRVSISLMHIAPGRSWANIFKLSHHKEVMTSHWLQALQASCDKDVTSFKFKLLNIMLPLCLSDTCSRFLPWTCEHDAGRWVSCELRRDQEKENIMIIIRIICRIATLDNIACQWNSCRCFIYHISWLHVYYYASYIIAYTFYTHRGKVMLVRCGCICYGSQDLLLVLAAPAPPYCTCVCTRLHSTICQTSSICCII